MTAPSRSSLPAFARYCGKSLILTSESAERGFVQCPSCLVSRARPRIIKSIHFDCFRDLFSSLVEVSMLRT